MGFGLETYAETIGETKEKIGESFEEYKEYWLKKRADWKKQDRLSAVRMWAVVLFLVGLVAYLYQ